MVALGIMVILFAWSVLKLIHTYLYKNLFAKSGSIGVNLSSASILLNIFGNAMRVALRFIVVPQVTLSYDKPLPVHTSIIMLVMHALSVGFSVASLGSIMGFWFDALRASMLTRMASRTKIMCALGAALSMLIIPGLILARSKYGVLGAILILFPYYFSTTVFIGITVILRTGCCINSDTSDLSPANKAKLNYVFRFITVASAAWVLLTATATATVLVKPMPGMDTLAILPMMLSIIAEGVMVWATMMLVERKVGPFKVVREVFCYRKLGHTVTYTKSTKGDSSSSIDTTASSMQQSHKPRRNSTDDDGTTPPATPRQQPSSDVSFVEEVSDRPSITTTSSSASSASSPVHPSERDTSSSSS